MIYNGAMEVPTIVTPVKLVTRDNINETLIKGWRLHDEPDLRQ
jgi:hypothetical protein